MNKKNYGNIYLGVGMISALIWVGFVVHSYFITQCQNRYGLTYNSKRKELGIPTIPDYWHIKERDENYIWWTGDERVIGHKRKSVAFSGCDIYSELDVYNLPIQNGKMRWIEIEYRYNTKYHGDSISYTYQVDHIGLVSSRILIDSILTAEKIKKDF